MKREKKMSESSDGKWPVDNHVCQYSSWKIMLFCVLGSAEMSHNDGYTVFVSQKFPQRCPSQQILPL